MAVKKDLLWQVGCEGFYDVWVCAVDWQLATLEAARMWDVPWREVAALCVLKKKQEKHNNVCAVCGRIYHGSPPLCSMCEKVQETEKQILSQRMGRYYQKLSKIQVEDAV